MLPRFIFLLSTSNLVSCAFFADVLNGLTKSKSPNIRNFVTEVPKAILSNLQDDEQAAAEFFCSILKGDVPEAISGLAEDVFEEIKDDFNDVRDFINSIPTLAPEVLQSILDGTIDVVDVIGKLFTDPGQAIAVIVDGAEKIFKDVFVGFFDGFVCTFHSSSCDGEDNENNTEPAIELGEQCKSALAQKISTIMSTTTLESTSYRPSFTNTAYNIPTTTINAALEPVPTVTLLPPVETTLSVTKPTANTDPIDITLSSFQDVFTEFSGATRQATLEITATTSAPQTPSQGDFSSRSQAVRVKMWMVISAFFIVITPTMW
ncbi:hypothetical protein BJ878DRAFT_519053 [Calycina marina]|uniref:Uncharacterized protein n=1 Tax=Calycina marina TaxID=1763456 RepID=A0A9P8CCM0_9HELO|nr:hypothetical protein BJ878DRAFT_519053 [Calycina marina]